MAKGDEAGDECYPELGNLSAGHIFRFLPRPINPTPAEFVYVPMDGQTKLREGSDLTRRLLVSEWNFAWEAAQLRHEMFVNEIEKTLPSLARARDTNVYLIPDTTKKVHAYLPLYMLLPKSALDCVGLPPLRRMLWPPMPLADRIEPLLPADTHERIAAAFAAQVWPLLEKGSPRSAFSGNDPIRLLSHCLDFWLPHAYAVIEDWMRTFPLSDDVDEPGRDDATLASLRIGIPDGVTVDRCRMGGTIWRGREEAAEALRAVTEAADQSGQLRGLIEAVRSNRVEEDFSSRWSYAREDFERRLYRKRDKIRVKFVELEKAHGVAGPNSEIDERMLWSDLFAMLNQQERQVIVCLTRSATSLIEVARELGYANHSPISKMLAKVRKKALDLLE